jgi:secreted trypsin-like serine protease
LEIFSGVAAKDSCSGNFYNAFVIRFEEYQFSIGDSGGPLVINEGGRHLQVGIVSWGIGCGKGQYPGKRIINFEKKINRKYLYFKISGVYSRVTSFMQWIMKNTREN